MTIDVIILDRIWYGEFKVFYFIHFDSNFMIVKGKRKNLIRTLKVAYIYTLKPSKCICYFTKTEMLFDKKIYYP